MQNNTSLKNKIRSYWDERAKMYGVSPNATGMMGSLGLIELMYLSDYFKNRKGIILDAGCGNGRVLKHILLNKQSELEVVGIDLSSEMINKAKENLKNEIPFLTISDLSNLPFAYSTFDYIYTVRSIEQILDFNDQLNVIENLIKLLKPQGVLLLIEGSQNGVHHLNRIKKLLRISQYEYVWHNLFLNEKAFEKHFSDLGFQVKEKRYFSFISIFEDLVNPFLRKIGHDIKLLRYISNILIKIIMFFVIRIELKYGKYLTLTLGKDVVYIIQRTKP